jgi:hypothetical protein
MSQNTVGLNCKLSPFILFLLIPYQESNLYWWILIANSYTDINIRICRDSAFQFFIFNSRNLLELAVFSSNSYDAERMLIFNI